MQVALKPYGPDDQRHWHDDDVALGRNLYQRLPEDRHDRQPLISGCGRYALVADVRLDNRDEIAAALGEPASSADTRCDAAWLLAAWERWGEGAFDRLFGDFALILWDRHERRLLLVRDPMGRRPLFFHRAGALVAAATMPKGLHALADVPRAPSRDAAAEYLLLMPAAERATMWEGVERVPPGAVVTVTTDRVAVRHWWQPRRPEPDGTPGDYAEGLRHHLDQAVAARLRGAGDLVATHLSSGFDSSSVTATAARLMAAQGGRVSAFTSVPAAGYPPINNPDAIIDEGPLAAATAALYPNVEHVLLRTGHVSPVETLDRDFFLYDLPVLNRCNMTWYTASLDGARQRGANVLLTGEVGNMSLSYNGNEYLVELLLAGRWGRLARTAWALKQRGTLRWRGIAARLARPFFPPALEKRLRGDRSSVIGDPLFHSALRREIFEREAFRERAAARGHDVDYRPWRNGWDMRRWVLGRVDMGAYAKGFLAGWGVDVRDPTSDRRLVEFCLSVPMGEYVRDGQFRSLARRALADRLPAELLNARGKGVQAIDWHVGAGAARAAIAGEVARLAEDPLAAELIDLPRLNALLAVWPETGWDNVAQTDAYRLALLRGVSTGHFLRRARGGNG